MSIYERYNSEMSNFDLLDRLDDRVGWLDAMALQIGEDDFGSFNEDIRGYYGQAMRYFAAEVKEIADILRKRG